MPHRAALYIPAGLALQRWSRRLTAVADAHAWQAATLVRHWEDLAELICGRLVDVGIIPSRAHLPPDRIPRLVAADEDQQGQLVIPGQRRPQIRWHPSRGDQPPRPPSARA
jgi:hypothetical protein